MNRVFFLTAGPGPVGSRVIPRLLGAGREARALPEIGDAQPDVHMLIFAVGLNHDTGRLDAAAGCEFVDDRIRQPQ